jgi:hypothetical protein
VSILRAAPLLLPLLIVASSAPLPSFVPGLWTQLATPEAATIDGATKGALPIDPPSPEQACMSPAQATTPEIWMTGNLAPNCRIGRSSLSGGKVSIDATCADPDGKETPSTLRMTGTWASDRFDVHFTTQTQAEGRTFGFSGHIVSHRLGMCPAS